jgi:hypothetical protein
MYTRVADVEEKVHPLIPISLRICHDFLSSFNEAGDIFNGHLHIIDNALRALERFNMLSQVPTKISPPNALEVTTSKRSSVDAPLG